MSYKLFITPFPVDTADGGGYVTREIMDEIEPTKVVVRSGSWSIKAINLVLGFCFLPFLHPLFTRYIPLLTIIGRRKKNIIFNFSQTFGGILFSYNSSAICHDLQCHNYFTFKRWARWSEAFLLKRTDQIFTLSKRDRKIICRLYGINPSRVSVMCALSVEKLQKIRKVVNSNVTKIVFLGNMRRRQNQEAIGWFSKEVMSSFPDLYLDVIGQRPIDFKGFHQNIRWLGEVLDVKKSLDQYELMIAPMQSKAGVKVKVFEALQNGLPVLGTVNAFSGLNKPSKYFCSNSVSVWCSTIKNGGIFVYEPSNFSRISARLP